MRNLVLGIVLALSQVAEAASQDEVIQAESTIDARLGKFRFELRNLGAVPYTLWESTPAELVVYRPSGNVLQRLSLDVEISSPWFEFVDLNGDGYVDLLVYNACAGFALCSGPTRAADVFIFSPKLGRFVKSKTLSGRGEIAKSKAKGCVVANYKSGSAGYTNETWCFDIKTGSWKMVGSSGSGPDDE